MTDTAGTKRALLSMPTSIGDVDTTWLTGALQSCFPGAAVKAVSVETIGTGVGLMGLLYRVTVDYEGSALSGPRSLIVKLPVLIDATRQVAAAYRHYEKEVAFYADLAPLTAVATPQVFYGAHDKDTDNFVLVMEDLRGLRPADQVAGCDPEDSRAAMAALAAHHASFWDDSKVVGDAYPWLPFGSDAPTPQGIKQGFAAYWEPFVEFMDEGLDPRILPLGDWVPAHAEDLLSVPPSRPFTVVDGDYRLDNLFFDEDRNVTVLDWQIATKGVGGYDFGYFVSQSLTVEERRARLDDLAATYLGSLSAAGITYDLPDFWDDVRKCVLFCLTYPVQIMALDLTDARAAALVREIANRSTSAILELGALELIE